MKTITLGITLVSTLALAGAEGVVPTDQAATMAADQAAPPASAPAQPPKKPRPTELSVDCSPGKATVTIDGRVQPCGNGVVQVAGGSHQVTARLPGYYPVETSFDTREEIMRLNVRLFPDAQAQRAAHRDQVNLFRYLALAGAGTGAVIALTGSGVGGYGVVARQQVRTEIAAYNARAERPVPEFDALKARLNGAYSTMLVGGGVAGAGVLVALGGAAAFFMAGDPEKFEGDTHAPDNKDVFAFERRPLPAEPPPPAPKPVLPKTGILAGSVSDEAGAPLAAVMEIIDDKGKSRKVDVGADGQFRQELNVGKYQVAVVAPGFLQSGRAIEVKGGGELREVLALKKEPTRRVTVLKVDRIEIKSTIYFEFNKTAVLQKSFPVLDEVVDVLLKNPQVTKIQVEGHTDDVGGAVPNKKLSEGRAQAVVDYLVANGVDASRLVPVGYGLERPIATGTDDASREKNRRVEFNILETAAREVQVEQPADTPAPTNP